MTTEQTNPDAIEIELDAMPTVAPRLTRTQEVIATMARAQSRAELERAIMPVRSWPEGAEKAIVRAALAKEQDRITNLGAAKPRVETIVRAPEPTQPRPSVRAMEDSRILYVWSTLWAPLKDALLATKSYKPVFQVGSDPKWYDNAQRYATSDEATVSASNRFMAWTAAKAYAVHPSTDPVSYTLAGPIATNPPAAPVVVIPEPEPEVITPATIQGALTQIQVESIVTPSYTGANNPVIQAAQTRAINAAITTGDFVIGAREEGSGVLISWSGLGELTQSQSVDALLRAGCPGSWGLVGRSTHAHASAALASIAQAGRIIKPVGKGRNSYGRKYLARWTVGMANDAAVGDTFGTVLMTAELGPGGVLFLDGDESLRERVRGEYNRRVENEVYAAGDVTEWLRRVIVTRFGAVRMGANWYLPDRTATQAERLCFELAKVWGEFALPALPIATTDQLRAGLTRGLAKEVATVLGEFETQRASARKAKAGSDIGASAAASLLAKLKDVKDRTKSYADLLGADSVATIRAELATAITIVEPLAGDTAVRFSLMELT